MKVNEETFGRWDAKYLCDALLVTTKHGYRELQKKSLLCISCLSNEKVVCGAQPATSLRCSGLLQPWTSSFPPVPLSLRMDCTLISREKDGLLRDSQGMTENECAVHAKGKMGQGKN